MTTFKNGLHKLLNDKYFWDRYKKCFLDSDIETMKNSRVTGYIPKSDALDGFILDYIFITKDERPKREIKLELLSNPQ